MFIRLLLSILVITLSFVIAKGQVPDVPKPSAAPAKMRDMPFRNGIDLQFLIQELARDAGLNVIFDPETFRAAGMKTFIELKNVTAAEALDYVLLQKDLYFEEVGPKTILVASRYKGTTIPPIGASAALLTDQLAEYFGVEGGVLISSVWPKLVASKAGLRAGDIIVAVDSVPVKGVLGIVGVINGDKKSDFSLTIVRKGKRQTVGITVEKSVNSVIQKP